MVRKLCRQIAYFHPKKIIIFDIYENNAYDLQNELLMQFKNLNLEVLIGSVRDRLRVEHVMDVCRPDVVFSCCGAQTCSIDGIESR